MSAFVISDAHLDALVQSAIVARLHRSDTTPMNFGNATETGWVLLGQNVRSVLVSTPCPEQLMTAVYGPDRHDESTPLYRFSGVEAPLDPAIMHSLWRCYRYQASDTDDFDNTEAGRLTADALDAYPLVEGLAPWAIRDITEALLAGKSGAAQ